MRCPSDAQARLLATIAEADEADITVEVRTDASRGWAELFVERIDRERNQARLEQHAYRQHRRVTVDACVRAGWLGDPHERMVTFPVSRRRAGTWWLAELELTEDGVIALGLWRERKLHAPPPPAPVLTGREREVVELAQRALELGYALCPREPARAEARAMRRAGWFKRGGCWVANNASGLVPTSVAEVEINPATADTPTEAETQGAHHA